MVPAPEPYPAAIWRRNPCDFIPRRARPARARERGEGRVKRSVALDQRRASCFVAVRVFPDHREQRGGVLFGEMRPSAHRSCSRPRLAATASTVRSGLRAARIDADALDRARRRGRHRRLSPSSTSTKSAARRIVDQLQAQDRDARRRCRCGRCKSAFALPAKPVGGGAGDKAGLGGATAKNEPGGSGRNGDDKGQQRTRWVRVMAAFGARRETATRLRRARP